MSEGGQPENGQAHSLSNEQIAGIAAQATLDKLRNIKKLSPIEIQKLAADYLAYVQEEDVYRETSARKRGVQMLSMAGKHEKALVQAQRGDYSGVRKYFYESGVVRLRGENGIPAELLSGLMFDRIAKMLPVTGEPYKPPKPAIYDPQFNPKLARHERNRTVEGDRA